MHRGTHNKSTHSRQLSKALRPVRLFVWISRVVRRRTSVSMPVQLTSSSSSSHITNSCITHASCIYTMSPQNIPPNDNDSFNSSCPILVIFGTSITEYTWYAKKSNPLPFFCKFLSNHLEFFDEILQLYSLFIWTYKCQISFNYLEI